MVINNRRAHGYENTRELCLVNVLVRDILREAERSLGVFAWLTHSSPWNQPDGGGEFTSRLRLNARDLRIASDWIDALEIETGREGRGGTNFWPRSWLMLLIGHCPGAIGRRRGAGVEADLRLARLLSQIDREPHRSLSLVVRWRRVWRCPSVRSLRHFREATGCSPADYLIHALIRQAEHLFELGDPRLSITEIAFRCGFNDNNYFARQFRQVTGTSPRGYWSAVSDNSGAFLGRGNAAESGRSSSQGLGVVLHDGLVEGFEKIHAGQPRPGSSSGIIGSPSGSTRYSRVALRVLRTKVETAEVLPGGSHVLQAVDFGIGRIETHSILRLRM